MTADSYVNAPADGWEMGREDDGGVEGHAAIDRRREGVEPLRLQVERPGGDVAAEASAAPCRPQAGIKPGPSSSVPASDPSCQSVPAGLDTHRPSSSVESRGTFGRNSDFIALNQWELDIKALAGEAHDVGLEDLPELLFKLSAIRLVIDDWISLAKRRANERDNELRREECEVSIPPCGS